MNPAVSRLLKWLCSVVGLLLVLGALGAFYLWSYYRTPVAAEAEDRIVSIAPDISVEWPPIRAAQLFQRDGRFA